MTMSQEKSMGRHLVSHVLRGQNWGSTPVPCHNGKVAIQLDRFVYLGKFFKAILNKNDIGLTNYDKVISDMDELLWQRVVEAEFKSMYFSQVYDLIEAPEKIKFTMCKLVYKRKRWVNGKVETYKARLVAEGYSKKTWFWLWEDLLVMHLDYEYDKWMLRLHS